MADKIVPPIDRIDIINNRVIDLCSVVDNLTFKVNSFNNKLLQLNIGKRYDTKVVQLRIIQNQKKDIEDLKHTINKQKEEIKILLKLK